jgi:hypothetical protein
MTQEEIAHVPLIIPQERIQRQHGEIPLEVPVPTTQDDLVLEDQRFCPRIVESELRFNCIGGFLVSIIHKKSKEGGSSAGGDAGSIYTSYGPDEVRFADLTKKFLTDDLPLVTPALGLAEEPIPLWWTTDFILDSPEGTPAGEEKWIVGEFNCSCVGISKCLAAYCKDDTPGTAFTDITEEDMVAVNVYAKKLGVAALGILGGASATAASAASGPADPASSTSPPSRSSARTTPASSRSRWLPSSMVRLYGSTCGTRPMAGLTRAPMATATTLFRLPTA